MRKTLAGPRDYRKLKEENYYVVDKGLMIRELMDRGGEATLITRPGCFHRSIVDIFGTRQEACQQ